MTGESEVMSRESLNSTCASTEVNKEIVETVISGHSTRCLDNVVKYRHGFFSPTGENWWLERSLQHLTGSRNGATKHSSSGIAWNLRSAGLTTGMTTPAINIAQNVHS